MELLSRVCLFVLVWSARTLGDKTGPSDVKFHIKEDDEVVLPCSLDKTDLTDKVFDWKKDKTEVFLYSKRDHYNNGLSGQDKQFEGRVFHFPDQLQFGNASIVIKKTKVADSGIYTCYFPSSPLTQHIHLTVDCILKDRTEENVPGACPEPVVTTRKTNNGVLLHCEARGASPKPEVELQDSAGNPVPAEEISVTEKKGYYDIILSGYVTKEGDYRCVVKQTEICHQIYSTETWVNPGAASEPYLRILKQTKDWALLQCVVRGASPKPKVFWQDSAGNVLPAKEPEITERGDSYDIILQTTVTKTDNYRCVATQEEINHQIQAETYIQMNVSEFPTGWAVAAIISSLLLVVAVVLLVLVSKGVIKLNCNKDQQAPTSISSNSVQHSDQDSKQPLNV